MSTKFCDTFKNIVWKFYSFEKEVSERQAILCLLTDIRRELQRLNNTFSCANAIAIPDILRRVEKNTKKRKPAKRRR